MDYRYLRELSEIFCHRGDAQILVCLAAGPPLRYSQLARTVTERTGNRLSDGELNRCLPRLESGGLVRGDGPDRRKFYRLTPRGEEKARLLTFILRALERCGPGCVADDGPS